MLESDSKRQAIHSLRGYAYQIWQSLYEWILLSSDEVLYLEGAEDIDKLGPQLSETIQVKDLQSDSVTLNSEEIVNGIIHYWRHKKQNPQVQIKYRFLTTAERGKEKSSQFGEKKGLDYWDDCKRKHIDLKPLKEFLLAKDTIPDDLKEFISIESDETIRIELILSIEWDTGNPERTYLEKIILDRLKEIGSRFGILPSASEKAMPALLKHVFEKACSANDRKLKYLDLIEVLEANTCVSVPINSMIAAFSTMTAQFEGVMPFISTDTASKWALIQQNIRPALPEKYSKREKLITRLKDRLLSYKFLTLHGSTGMGKSTLGTLLVDHLGLEYKWINLRGKDANSINAILYNIALSVKNYEDTIIVIDDISFRAEQSIFENAFVGLINIVLLKNGYVIITTQDDLPDKVSHYFPHIDDLIVDVPAMDLDEIRELSTLHSCPTDKRIELWCNFILIKTGGHPQLVHAKIRSLESKGWPIPTIEILTEPDDFETIKIEVKKRLISDISFDSARTLSYRLSILLHPFKIQHALIMGDMSPSIEKPGEAFGLLIGPWIERLSSGYYRLSPLLNNIAEEIWSKEEVKKLHSQAVKALLSEKTLSPIEVSNAIFHGIIGESGELLMPLIYFLIENKKNILPKMSEDLRWLTFLATTPGQKIYQNNPGVSLSLRYIQFRLAVNINEEDTAIKVAQAWEKEIEDISINEFKSLSRILFLFETLISREINFPFQLVLSRVKEIIQLLSKSANIIGKKFKKSLHDINPILSITILAIEKCKRYNDLIEFINTLDKETDDTINYYLHVLNSKEDWSDFLINQVYLNEFNSSSPEWLKCLEAFNQTIEKALTWKALRLVSSAYHMIAVIYDEHLDDTDKALEVLDEARKYLGTNDRIIEDARAMIFFRHEKHEDALRILEKILPIWNSCPTISLLLAYRRAEISAARLGRWDKSATLAENGANYALKLGNKTKELGFRADQAFALWKADDRQKSIELFTLLLHDFHLLPDPHGDLHSYALQKIIGHTLMWLLHDVLNDHIETHAEPQPGCFSNYEVDGRIKNYPLQSIEFFWMALAEIENELKIDDKIFKHFRDKYHKTQYPAIKTSLTKLVILHSLRKHDLSSLIQAFYDFVVAVEATKKIVLKPNDLFKEMETCETVNKSDDFYESLIILLCFALVDLFIQNKNITKMITSWKRDAERLGLTDSKLLFWFNFIESVTSKNEYELTQILSDGAAGIGARMVACYVPPIRDRF